MDRPHCIFIPTLPASPQVTLPTYPLHPTLPFPATHAHRLHLLHCLMTCCCGQAFPPLSPYALSHPTPFLSAVSRLQAFFWKAGRAWALQLSFILLLFALLGFHLIGNIFKFAGVFGVQAGRRTGDRGLTPLQTSLSSQALPSGPAYLARPVGSTLPPLPFSCGLSSLLPPT